MMLLVILAPLALAAVALAVPSNRRRPAVLLAGAVLHAGGVAALFVVAAAGRARRLARASTPLAKVTLLTTTILFLASAVYAQGYLAQRTDRDNRVFVGGLLGLLGTMTTVALSQHLGLTWVAMEASTLVDRAAHLLQPQRPLARGDLEVPAHRLARHRARAPRDVLPRALRRRPGRPALAVRRRAHRGRARALAPLGARRVRLPPRRLRHEDGARAAPLVEAGRLRRGAGAARRAARGRAHELRVPGDRAGVPGDARGRRGGVRARRARRARAPLDRARRRLRRGPEGLQADAGVLERRAHGHPRARDRARRRRRRRARSSTASTTASRRASCSSPPGTSTAPSARRRPTRCAAPRGSSRSPGRCSSRGSSRSPARRRSAPFFSEFAILNGAFGAGRFGVGALFLVFLAVIFVGMGTTVLAVVQGDPGDAARARGSRETLAHGGAAARAHGARARSSGCTCRRG